MSPATIPTAGRSRCHGLAGILTTSPRPRTGALTREPQPPEGLARRHRQPVPSSGQSLLPWQPAGHDGASSRSWPWSRTGAILCPTWPPALRTIGAHAMTLVGGLSGHVFPGLFAMRDGHDREGSPSCQWPRVPEPAPRWDLSPWHAGCTGKTIQGNWNGTGLRTYVAHQCEASRSAAPFRCAGEDGAQACGPHCEASWVLLTGRTAA